VIKDVTGVIAPIVENIPEELTERPQWVLWRYEERAGKFTKIPYTDRGQRASSTDLMTWTTCAEAHAAYERGDYDGIGFVFSSGDPFCSADLDHCRDPETGDIEPWAKEILERVPKGYVEASPSGTGVHIITRGSVRGGGMRKGSVEMYSRGRYFSVTGQVL
jgi:putative DNA primase/helicase